MVIVKGKGKGRPRTGHKGPEGEQKHSSALSLTSALEWGGWSTLRSGRFTPEKTRYPLYIEKYDLVLLYYYCIIIVLLY